jgi:hypothetical protein
MSAEANSVGSQNPFIAFKDGDEYIKKLDQDPRRDDIFSSFCSFILNGSELSSAQIFYAHKQI